MRHAIAHARRLLPPLPWVATVSLFLALHVPDSGATAPIATDDEYVIEILPLDRSGIEVRRDEWAVILNGRREHQRFGNGIAVADFDGDGCDDLLIAGRGMPQDGLPVHTAAFPEGAIWIVRGAPDGVADHVLRIHPGGRGTAFGRCVTTADFNGDGRPEAVASGGDRRDGSAFNSRLVVWDWPDPGQLPSPRVIRVALPDDLPAPTRPVRLTALGAGTDIDGDGHPDLVAGFPNWDGDARDTGLVVWLRGGKDGGLSEAPLVLSRGSEPDARHGGAVLLPGDLDGDGIGDVVVGAAGASRLSPTAGRVEIFLGAHGGPSPVPAMSIDGSEPGAGLGRELAAAGDLNGDGFHDVWIGASGAWNDGASSHEDHSGAAFLFHGAPDGLETRPAWSMRGDEPGGKFGHSIALVGDMDGDGSPEVAIGAPSATANSTFGRVFLFPFPIPSGNEPASLGLCLHGSLANHRRGGNLTAPVDLNGDGLADLVNASPITSDPRRGANHGHVEIILGRRHLLAELKRHPPTFNGRIRSLDLRNERLHQIPVAPVVHHPSDGGAVWRTALLFGSGTLMAVGLLAFPIAWYRRRRERSRFARLLEAERRRIAESLHDEVAAELGLIALMREPADPDDARKQIRTMREAARRAAGAVREAAWQNNPDNDRLPALADYLADETVRFAAGAGLESRTHIPPDLPARLVSPAIRRHCLLSVKELLHNAGRAGRCRQVAVSISLHRDTLHVTVEDDGVGFDPAIANGIGGGAGQGLRNLKRRSAELGGAVEIDSRPEHGARITISIPLTQEDP